MFTDDFDQTAAEVCLSFAIVVVALCRQPFDDRLVRDGDYDQVLNVLEAVGEGELEIAEFWKGR